MKAKTKLLVLALTMAGLLAVVTAGATAGGSQGDGDWGHPGGPPPGSVADPLTGFPNQINQVDLSGYQIVTSYPLGFDAGNTFQQTYHSDGTFTAVPLAGPFVGQPPTTARYIALPVGHKQILLVWLFADGTHNTFVMNFRTHIVSVVTAGPDGAPSLGTVKITQWGDHPIP
jgi:hypothetical protein